MVTLYGITPCDTVRKARHWLEAAGVAYRFHDYRRDGLTHVDVERWAAAIGWEKLLNKASTSWRELNAGRKEQVDRTAAIALMLEVPTLIKRPVLIVDDKVLSGFSPEAYAALLSAKP